jgi:pimeloyl-ACP methyl ester carboxylesterase
MTSPEYLEPEPGRRLAYHRLAASDDAETAPGVVFLGGFKSDMTGTKAVFLESWCQERGRAFLRFDYTGHGQSSGDFLDGCIGDWARDAHDAVTALTEGPQIIVGSSMGGWIALLLARRAPERVAALVGIAAAPDFTEAQRAAIMAEGRLDLPSEYSDEPYVITRRLIEDGREQLVLRTPLLLPFPVRLLQGTADEDVPQERALILLEHLESPDARLQLVKGADHRFSEARELGILAATLDEVSATA